MEYKWDCEETTNLIAKNLKVLIYDNDVKIGNHKSQKPFEEVDTKKINEILEKKISLDTMIEYDILCDCKIIIECVIKYLNDIKKTNYEENIDINLFFKKIQWIKNTCIVLAENRLLNEVIYTTETYSKKTNCILRNSYNFCDNSYDCKYYYNQNSKYKKNNTCNKQHFVYNYIVCDINEIEKYIKSIDDKKLLNFEEISKSIKTLNFVIEHMRNEINCRNKNLNSTINKVKKSNIFGLGE